MATFAPKPKTLTLAALVRQVGYERRRGEDPDEIETRLEHAIRGLWEAAAHSPQAFKELTERGWGRMPMAVTVSVVGQGLIEHAQNLGLKPEHVAADPSLLALFLDGGVEIVDGEFRITDVEIVA